MKIKTEDVLTYTEFKNDIQQFIPADYVRVNSDNVTLGVCINYCAVYRHIDDVWENDTDKHPALIVTYHSRPDNVHSEYNTPIGLFIQITNFGTKPNNNLPKKYCPVCEEENGTGLPC